MEAVAAAEATLAGVARVALEQPLAALFHTAFLAVTAPDRLVGAGGSVRGERDR